eukprot:COSAG06_NODE_43385_length_372_cov_1.238095_2_plen_52_part_01
MEKFLADYGLGARNLQRSPPQPNARARSPRDSTADGTTTCFVRLSNANSEI